MHTHIWSLFHTIKVCRSDLSSLILNGIIVNEKVCSILSKYFKCFHYI